MTEANQPRHGLAVTRILVQALAIHVAGLDRLFLALQQQPPVIIRSPLRRTQQILSLIHS